MLNKMFNIQAGSVTGWGHLRQGIDNQDGHLEIEEEDLILLIGTDGCSGQRHPEVGARVGPRTIGKLIRPMVKAGHFATGDPAALQQSCQLLFQDIVASLDRLVAEIARPWLSNDPLPDEERRAVVEDFMFFTFVAAIITPSWTTVISFGDGVYAINGRVVEIKPARRSGAPYLAHHMLGSQYPFPLAPDYNRITVQCSMQTEYLKTLAVGTDGLSAVIAAANSPFPASPDKTVGPLSQLWEDPFFDVLVQGSFGRIPAITYWLMSLRAPTAARVVVPVLGGSEPLVYDENFPELMCDDVTIIVAKLSAEFMRLKEASDLSETVELDTAAVRAALAAPDESAAQ